MDFEVDDRLLTPGQVAARWQVQAELLANWRHAGVGPAYVKIGHAVRYRTDAIHTYERDHEVNQAARVLVDRSRGAA